MNSVVLLESLTADGTTSYGTGWWIAAYPSSSAWMVTAFHVVGEEGEWRSDTFRIVDEAGDYLVDEAGDEVALNPVTALPEADLALLATNAPLTGRTAPLRLGRPTANRDWHADGFPEINFREKFSLNGQVIRVEAGSSPRALQLGVAQGTGVHWGGVSGAPVVVDRRVVGVVTEMIEGAATSWAASSIAVKELLARAGATVVPSPERGALKRFLSGQLRKLGQDHKEHRVPLRVVREMDGLDVDVDPVEAAESQLFRNLWPTLLSRRHRRILLAGVPGAGKTVSLAELAQHLIERALGEIDFGQEPSVLPLWIPASELPRWEQYGFELLEKRLRDARVRTNDLDAWLDEGRIVLLVDGLQEVAEGSERWSSLRGLLELSGPTIVATSRQGFASAMLGERWEVFRLQGLQPADRLMLMEREGLKATSRFALERLARRSRLAKAVTVPQMWRMALALARRDPEKLEVVHSPTMLYDAFVEDSLRRGIHQVQFAEGERLDAREVGGVFELLGAAVVFKQQAQISRDEAIELCTLWLTRRSQVLRQTVRSGHHLRLVDLLPRYFLAVLGEEAPAEDFWADGDPEPNLAFAHESLAEFLAARCLIQAYRHGLPDELLEEPVIAAMLAFDFDLRERRLEEDNVSNRAEHVAELDRRRVEVGSPELVAEWIRHAPRERIEQLATELTVRVGEEIDDRLRAGVLVQALRSRGLAWARRLIQPERLEEAVQAPLLAMLERGRWRKKRSQKKRSQKKPQKVQGQDIGLLRLAAQLDASTESWEQTRLLKTITALGAKGEVPAVISSLESSDANQVRAALEAVAVLGDHAAAPALRRLLSSSDDHIRGAAARATGLLQDVEVVPLLEQMLKGDPDGTARGRAATALGRIGDPRVVDSLIQALDPKFEKDGTTRGRAATALGKIGDPRAVDALIRTLDPDFEKNGIIRGSAATALGQIGDPRAAAALIRTLDPDFEKREDTRGSAEAALDRLKLIAHQTERTRRKLGSVWKTLRDTYLEHAVTLPRSRLRSRSKSLRD